MAVGEVPSAASLLASDEIRSNTQKMIGKTTTCTDGKDGNGTGACTSESTTSQPSGSMHEREPKVCSITPNYWYSHRAWDRIFVDHLPPSSRHLFADFVPRHEVPGSAARPSYGYAPVAAPILDVLADETGRMSAIPVLEVGAEDFDRRARRMLSLLVPFAVRGHTCALDLLNISGTGSTSIAQQLHNSTVWPQQGRVLVHRSHRFSYVQQNAASDATRDAAGRVDPETIAWLKQQGATVWGGPEHGETAQFGNITLPEYLASFSTRDFLPADGQDWRKYWIGNAQLNSSQAKVLECALTPIRNVVDEDAPWTERKPGHITLRVGDSSYGTWRA